MDELTTIIGVMAAIITIFAFIWTIFKKYFKKIEWKVEEKEVDQKWINISGATELWANKGFKLVWANRSQVEGLLLKDYVFPFENNLKEKIKHKPVRKGQVLMGKPCSSKSRDGNS